MRPVLIFALIAAAVPVLAQNIRTSADPRLDRAYHAYVRAEQRCEAARSRRINGQAPLPGERRGLAGGGSRLLPEYFQRQRDLARKETLACRQAHQAAVHWNELK